MYILIALGVLFALLVAAHITHIKIRLLLCLLIRRRLPSCYQRIFRRVVEPQREWRKRLGRVVLPLGRAWHGLDCRLLSRRAARARTLVTRFSLFIETRRRQINTGS